MTPALSDLDAELRALARAELRLGDDEPIPDTLAESLDSVQRLTLVVAIEDRYAICFDPDDEQGAQTFEDVVRLVHKKLSQQDADADAT